MVGLVFGSIIGMGAKASGSASPHRGICLEPAKTPPSQIKICANRPKFNPAIFCLAWRHQPTRGHTPPNFALTPTLSALIRLLAGRWAGVPGYPQGVGAVIILHHQRAFAAFGGHYIKDQIRTLPGGHTTRPA